MGSGRHQEEEAHKCTSEPRLQGKLTNCRTDASSNQTITVLLCLQLKDEAAVNAARRAGVGVETVKKGEPEDAAVRDVSSCCMHAGSVGSLRSSMLTPVC